MDTPHIAKMISLYTKGVVTAPEMANSLLIYLIRDNSCDTELPSLLGRLPNAVQQKFLDLLREIQAAEYRWKPFMIGPGGSVLHSDADDPVRLRRLCSVLEISQGAATNGSELGKSDGM